MRRGSYAIEFGLLLPILLTLASGVVDVGHYLVSADALTAAVADGARAGALTEDLANQAAVAEAVAQQNFNAADLPVTATFVSTITPNPPDTQLELVGTVDIDYYFGWLNLPATITYQITIRTAYQ